jgi:hypothetical protein
MPKTRASRLNYVVVVGERERERERERGGERREREKREIERYREVYYYSFCRQFVQSFAEFG